MIHCSALPRIMQCPASAVPPQVKIDQDNPAGRIGTAVHEVLAGAICSLAKPSAGMIAEIAANHDADAEQVAPLSYIGWSMWQDIADDLKVLGVEQRGEWGGRLTGRLDLVCEAVNEDVPALAIVDWKSGNPERDYLDQTWGYAKVGRETYPQYQAVKVIILWLRSQEREVKDATEAKLADFEDRLARVEAHPDEYKPSPEACEFCPRAHECKARTALVRKSVNDFAVTEVDAIKALSVQSLAGLYPKAQLVGRVLDAYKSALKVGLIKASKPISLGDGRELGLDERKRETLDTAAVVAEGAAMNLNVTPALSVSKSKLSKLIGASVEKGKGQAIEAFLDKLRASGAVTETTYKVIQLRKEAGE